MTSISFRQVLSAALACTVALLLVVTEAPQARAAINGRAVGIAADPLGPGYWILMADGRVIPRGSARGDGRAGDFKGVATALASYPTGKGFWRVKRNGRVRAVGAADVTARPKANRDSKIVGLAAHHGGRGLWRVTALGQTSATGTAKYYGRVRSKNRIRAMTAHPERSGYWVVNRIGRVFAYGAARVMGDRAGRGATGIAAHPSGDGYWVVKRNGRVTSYGVAGHYGNARLDVPVVDIAAAPDGAGYWILARDGRVRAFGSARSGMISTSSPPTPELATVKGITVATKIRRPLRRMLNKAADAGIRYGGWGYRSYDRQVELRRDHCGVRYYDVFVKSSSECYPMTAVPGRSLHERGLAIDFHRIRKDGSIVSIAGTRAFRWLKRHADNYGLYNLPSEPWHWSTTGG